MIRGYPARVSLTAGERLTLHVSTDAARFRAVVYRWAGRFERVLATEWLPGVDAADGAPAQDWEWPDYSVDTGTDWPSGAYIVHLEEALAPVPRSIAVDTAAMLVVVRPRAPAARILYKLPFATYHAYNVMGGGCFYVQPPRSLDPPGARLTWRRPGGGIGGVTHGAPDVYDRSSQRQTFAHWDARFIGWLARQGIDVDVCADIDLHHERVELERYALLLSAGHDEYWSAAMRDRAERYIERGGNVAFFGANVCWWRIHLVDDDTAMVCHQGGPRGALDHWWPDSGAHRPEDALTGVSYRHGGGWWDGERSTRGFIVQRGEHWVFERTGLATGARFGQDTTPPLVGYECDGAPLEWTDEKRGLVRVSPDAERCGTPAGFVPLAVGPLDTAWQELPHRETHAAAQGLHTATMGLYRRGGTVFTAGTTDWAQVLASGSAPAVERITRNVIDQLGR